MNKTHQHLQRSTFKNEKDKTLHIPHFSSVNPCFEGASQKCNTQQLHSPAAKPHPIIGNENSGFSTSRLVLLQGSTSQMKPDFSAFPIEQLSKRESQSVTKDYKLKL